MKQQDKNRLLEAYQKGTISSEDKRILELAALEDTFLFESLEGSHKGDISIDQLRERLHSKVKKSRRRTLWLPAIAASLLLISAVMWWNSSDSLESGEQQIAQITKDKNDLAVAVEQTLTGENAESSDESFSVETSQKLDIQKTTVQGVPVQKSDVIVQNNQDIAKKQLDAYLQQKPTVTASRIEAKEKKIIVEDESEEEIAEEFLGDLNTEYSPERNPIKTEPALEEKEVIEADDMIAATQEAPARAKAQAAPAKKRQEVNAAATNENNDYPVLDEVMVTNSSISRPEMGYGTLKKFINENKGKGLPSNFEKGRVRLKYIADADGKLGSFKVIQSINEDMDKHAIELMKKTGKWSPGNATFTVEY